jgi:hypothetical protein
MTPEGEQEEKVVEILLPNTTIVTHCILKNDTQRLVKCFEDDEDEYKDTVAELINQRGEDGKSPLDVAATLGRVDMSRELIQRGADVMSVNCQGRMYSLIPWSWNHRFYDTVCSHDISTNFFCNFFYLTTMVPHNPHIHYNRNKFCH